MICRVGDRRFFGEAVHLEGDRSPERVARAVRTGTAPGEPRLEVEAPEPEPLHDYVGCIQPGLTLRPRTALAHAARSLGYTTPHDDALERARAALADLTVEPSVPTDAEARRELADATAEIDRLRERAASARGRAQAVDDPDAGETLEEAIRSLSAVETRAAAARERRQSSRAAARETRDRLEERLRLVDRRDNLERRARRDLVAATAARYRRALRAVPGVDRVADPFEAPPDAMALAVARVGDPAAPVVEASGRFADARAAANWLDSPVVHLEP